MKQATIILKLNEIRMVQLALDQRGDSLSDESKASDYYVLADFFRKKKKELQGS